MAQAAMISALLGFVLPLSYGLNWLLNRFYPQRIGTQRRAAGPGYVRTRRRRLPGVGPSLQRLSLPLKRVPELP